MGYAIFSLGSYNGCFDSDRTIEAAKHHDVGNPVKTIASVEEEWSDNSALAFASSMMGGGGYNPHVTRRIVFEDGSQGTISYRTLACQPIRKWLRGDEFDPKPGEKYEVFPSGQLLVRKVE